MVKYKEIVSTVLDLLKVTSDDSIFTEEHIIYLAGIIRSFLLKQRYYNDLKKSIPESNYQTICLDLEKVEKIDGIPCKGYYLRTTEEVPTLIPIGNHKVFPDDNYYYGEITFVSPQRFKYTGNNKWFSNIIYATLGPDNKLYLKSENPQFLYLQKIEFHGIFENAAEASDLECKNNSEDLCDIMDRDFPMEDSLVSTLIDQIIKSLSPSIAVPEDTTNNAKDDLSGVSK